MIVSLTTRPGGLEILGYDKIDILAIYPIGIKKGIEPPYDSWCQAMIALEAICICDGEVCKVNFDDITFDAHNNDAEYEIADAVRKFRDDAPLAPIVAAYKSNPDSANDPVRLERLQQSLMVDASDGLLAANFPDNDPF